MKKNDRKNKVPKLFIDLGVVIDFFTDRMPGANPASELFDWIEKRKIETYLSAISIHTIYFIVRRFLGHRETLKIAILASI